MKIEYKGENSVELGTIKNGEGFRVQGKSGIFIKTGSKFEHSPADKIPSFYCMECVSGYLYAYWVKDQVIPVDVSLVVND